VFHLFITVSFINDCTEIILSYFSPDVNRSGNVKNVYFLNIFIAALRSRRRVFQRFPGIPPLLPEFTGIIICKTGCCAAFVHRKSVIIPHIQRT
jgi:hypothetical protein